MKLLKYLFALWTGVLIYVVLSVIFGAVGFSAYRQLEGEQKKQEANIENLKLINRNLGNTMNSLLYDKDTLTVYAREQGYASPGERFIRIVGLGGNQRSSASVGEVVNAMDPLYTPDETIIIIAFCMGITLIICMAAFDIMKYLTKH